MILKTRVESMIQIQSLELQKVISDYESSTESKRKQYEYLKEQDDLNSFEIMQFPKLHLQLLETVENLKNETHTLQLEREESIFELKNQLERLSTRIWKLRQEMKLNQTIDALQLKRLSVTSSTVIKVYNF